MKKLIQKIYKDKANYYNEVIASFDAVGINYLLLNVLVADEQPGDLDIIISPEQYNTAIGILSKFGFRKYCHYNSQQILWNKYIYGLSFIQIHIHLDFCFYGKKILLFQDIYQNTNLLSLKQEYLFFLIESFYKNQYLEKLNKFKTFQSQIDRNNLEHAMQKYFSKTSSAIQKAENVYLKEKQPGKWKFLIELIKENKINALAYITLHTLRKIKKKLLADKNDIVMVFLGPDGVGKTSIIKNFRAITSKGGLYSRVVYMGIKESLVNSLRIYLSQLTKKPVTETSFSIGSEKKNKPFVRKTYHVIIGILYWLEYNLRWLFKIKFRKVTAQTVWLLDRSFFDVLIHYDSRLLTYLFLKLSFRINTVFFLTADTDKLCARKSEHSAKELENMKTQYDSLRSKIEKFHKKIIVADTSLKNISEMTHFVIREAVKTIEDNAKNI